MILAETPLGLVALALAGAIAGAVNTVAGGGSLVSFPALIGLGLPSLPANATNSVALWPGSLAGAIGLLNKLRHRKRTLLVYMIPTVLGSVVGVWALVRTGEDLFNVLVPVLILGATLLLAFQKRLRAWATERNKRLGPGAALGLQFGVAVYGGYFGAGMGILMLAVLGLAIEGDIHELNAFKNWLGLLINMVASVLLLAQGLVQPVPGLALGLGAIVGGYAAGRLSQRVDPDKLRRVIVVYGFGMSAWFMLRLAMP